MADKLRVGLIGCGNIAPAYVRGMQPYSNVQLVACADIDEKRATTFAVDHNIQAHSITALLEQSDIDIVLNLTPPKFHATVDLQIIKAGKNVYSEKPLAVDFSEAAEIIATANELNVRVGCAPDTFLGGGIQTCRKLIDEGIIGKPIAATAFMAIPGHESWHPNPSFYYDIGGGPMLDMGPYYLTALVNLLGPIKRVTGSTGKGQDERIATSPERNGERIPVHVDTHLAGIFEFENGPIVSMLQSFDVQAHNLPIIEIYGTEGTLSVPDPNTFGGTVKLYQRKNASWETMPLSHSDKVARGIGVADMASGIITGRKHRANGDLALHVLEAMLAVTEAAQSGCHIVLQTTCERPPALPVGLVANEID